VRGFICTIDRSREEHSRFLRDARARARHSPSSGRARGDAKPSRERRGKAAEKRGLFNNLSANRERSRRFRMEKFEGAALTHLASSMSFIFRYRAVIDVTRPMHLH